MQFSDYIYTRPDYKQVKEEMTKLTQALNEAQTADQAREIVEQIIAIERQVDTQNNLWSIRHSIDLNDDFYNEETKFWNEYGPLFGELTTNYYQAVLTSPFRSDLSDILPDTFFQIAENKLKTFSPEAIPLFQKENDLMDAYNKLIASAKLDFEGETRNLAQLIPFLENPDRQIRQVANELREDFFAKNGEEFDRIYDQLVKVRHEIATTLGFKDYVEYGYLLMNRLDYNRDMVKTYREEIRQHVVPVVQNLRAKQAKRLGLEKLAAHDFNIEFPNGNAKPIGTPEEIVANAQKMYHELSPETGEFFDFMVDNGLLDLVAKPGKASGGYCTYIPDYQSPFIFSNFNGTSGDIDVMTHEAGHAFQVYNSRWVKPLEAVWPTYESAEIHSMSMEFLTYPYMERFFGDQTQKYYFSHLSGTLLFLPYGVLVDHFQHEVYEHPEMTPAERRAKWTELRKLYMPDRVDSDTSAVNWFHQGHLFSAPFYYIDYTLAQVCALQFWRRTQVENDQTAWADYLAICKLGGTKSFLDIVATANLKSPFEEGALADTIQLASDYLNKIDDLAL